MAEYEITTPDGQVITIEGPDNASDEQVIGFAQQYLNRKSPGKYRRPVYGGKNPPKAAPEDIIVRPWTDQSAFGQAANSVAGWVNGAGSYFDIPTRALGAGLGVVTDLVGLPDWVGDNLRNPVTIGGTVDTIVPRSQTTTGRLARATGEGMGAAMTGVGAGMKLAQSSAPVARSVGELLGVMPGQQGAAGAAAGAAAEGANLLGAPVPVQIGAGVLAGGVTPSALRGTAGAVDAAVDRLTAPGAAREAANYIRGNMTKPQHEVIAALESSGPSVSGAKPTLAEVSQDPGLASVQRSIGNLHGPSGARISARIGDNAQRRMAAIDDTLGRGNPADIATAAASRERSLNALTGEAVEQVGPLVPPDVAGTQARGALSQGYQAARARTADAYGSPILQDNPAIQLRPLDRADVQLPTRGDARPIEAFQDQAVKGYRSALPNRPRSLLEYVRARGGVDAEGMGADDLRSAGMDATGQPTLVRQGGVPLDMLREGAVEAGYVDEATDLAEFTSLLQAEYAGAAPRFALGDDAAKAAYDEAQTLRNFWRQQFDERSLDPSKMTTDDWVRFHAEVDPSAASAGTRGLDDLQGERMPGSLAGPFQQTIMSLRQRFFGDGGAEAPATVRAFMDDVINADEVGIKTLEGWERQAMDLASKAPDRTAAAALQAIGRAIGAKASSSAGPERRAALETARGVRREQGDVYETGAVGRVMERGDYGRMALPDSEVGRVVVPRGNSGGQVADQLKQAAGETAETIARTELRRALDDAGSDPRLIAKVSRDYKEVVSRFPSLDRDMRTARANAALSSRFEKSQLGGFLKENTDPASAVARLLTVKDNGVAFQALVNGPGMTAPALAGVRRGIAEHIKAISRTAVVDANLQGVPSTRKMIDGVVTTLQRTRGTSALAPAQRAVLNAVRKELAKDQFARSTNRPSGSDTARNIGMALNMFERAMNIVPDTGGIRNVTQMLFKYLARTEDIMGIVTQAIEDPKFAAELLRRPSADRVGRVLEGAIAYNRAAAIGASASASEVPAQAQ